MLKVGRSSSMQTGLSWPCLSRSLPCCVFPDRSLFWSFHHFFAFCHWRRITMKSESMKKTSMISMTQTTEQLIQRPSWPPKLERRMTSWKRREHKVICSCGRVSTAPLRCAGRLHQAGAPRVCCECYQMRWALPLLRYPLLLCFSRSSVLCLLQAAHRLPWCRVWDCTV